MEFGVEGADLNEGFGGRVQCSGFRVRVQDSGFQDSGFRIEGLRVEGLGSGFRV